MLDNFILKMFIIISLGISAVLFNLVRNLIRIAISIIKKKRCNGVLQNIKGQQYAE